MRHFFYSFSIACLLFLLVGCDDASKDQNSDVRFPQDTFGLAQRESDSTVVVHVDTVSQDTVVDLQASVDIEGDQDTIPYDTLGEPFNIDLPQYAGEETLSVEMGLGDDPNGRKIAFITDEWIILEVWESYETSVTIRAEGPHCDLINWKHYYSPGEKLRSAAEENQFIGKGYHWTEFEYFPKMGVNELKRYAKGYCEGWGPIIDKIEEVGEYPSGVSVSAFHFRVRAKSKQNGREKRFVVRVVMPMGC